MTRLRFFRFPLSFVASHPIRAARNMLGNHSSPLADRYLRGLKGVEIGGAAHNDFLLDTINVDISVRPSTAPAQLAHAGRIMPVDVVASADALPFADGAYDFVLASHVLEHIPDPIRALQEWCRVARRYVYVILPHRDNEFDTHRQLTTIQELAKRYRATFTSELDAHWSVWSSETFRELGSYLGLSILEVQDPDDKRGNGFAVVIEARTNEMNRDVRSG